MYVIHECTQNFQKTILDIQKKSPTVYSKSSTYEYILGK